MNNLKMNGEVRVFANTYEKRIFLSAQIGSHKNQKTDEWINLYADVSMSKEVSEKINPDKMKKGEYIDLIVKEAWLNCYKDKNDIVKPVLFINDAKVVK